MSRHIRRHRTATLLGAVLIAALGLLSDAVANDDTSGRTTIAMIGAGDMGSALGKL